METQGQAWKGRMLSQAGKETLLKAVIQAIPTYLMSVFFLSSTLTKKMDSLLRNFFWAGDMNKKSIHWSSGQTLCETKARGGLGFKSFTDFNLALLAKQGWRILMNPEALWVKLLKSIYFPRTDFLTAKKGARPSWIWASIFKARDVVALGAFKRVGDGTSININDDPWIPSLPKFTTPFNGCSDQMVSEWINPVAREWDLNRFERFFSPQATRAILSVPIGPTGVKDEWTWSFRQDGKDNIIKIAAVLWNIWKARNEVVFRGTTPSHYETNLRIASDMELWKTPIVAAKDNPGRLTEPSRSSAALNENPQLVINMLNENT
ncbi:Uncharacterized mitochondrial protein AtMg00310 [Linum perenne]